MPRYELSEDTLAGLIRAGDSRRFKVDLKNDRSDVLAEAFKVIQAGNLNLASTNKTKLRGETCFSIGCYGSNLTIRYINRFLTGRMRIEMPSRERIVRTVITSLSDATPLYLFRRDIKNFYESIEIKRIRKRLLSDRSIPKKIKGCLYQYFEYFCPGDKGLPRGIALSAVLAELIMEEYDQRIKRTHGVYRYFRFSDDILIICYRPDAIENAIGNLPDGLSFNQSKKQDYILDENMTTTPTPISYLGYDFICEKSKRNNKPRELEVKISDKKIKRIKTKLVLSFANFNRYGNFEILLDRIRFLSGNYKVKRSGVNKTKGSLFIKSGIYYNYSQCGLYRGVEYQDYRGDELRKLDGFYNFLLKRPDKLVGSLAKSPLLSQEQYSALRRISFLQGYQKRIAVYMSDERIHAIKAIWRHV